MGDDYWCLTPLSPILQLYCGDQLTMVEESGENHQPAACHWKFQSHNVNRVHVAMRGFDLTTLVVIGTDSISRCTFQLPYTHGHDVNNNKIVSIRRVWRHQKGIQSP
jgi:hypothetical protein